MFAKLAIEPVNIGIRFVHLVGCHDDLDVGLTGKADRFDSLRLDAVVCGDHDDHEIGQLCPMLAQSCEGFVAGRIKECDLTVVPFNLISRDMLRYAARFTLDDLGATDSIQ